jgi:DNA-binding transcriptional LysR family regulator
VYVPGVTPDKWLRVWNERHRDTPLILHQAPPAEARDLLVDGGADAGLVRLPVDRTVLSAIPLYTEQTVVVVPRDHLVTAADEVSPEDLADDIVLHPLDDVLDWPEGLPGRPALERPATTADAVELVAAGIGVLVVPLSLARLHHRKDLTHRPLTHAPESSVVLSWPEAATTDEVEDFIGIVRGRTVNSTRGRSRPAVETRAATGDRKPSAGSAGKKAGSTAKKGSTGRAGGGKTAGGKGGGTRRGSAPAPRGARRGKPRGRS